MSPTVSIPDSSVASDVCAICGRDTSSSAFCHVYLAGQRVALCSPACAEAYMHRDDTGSGVNVDPFATPLNDEARGWDYVPPAPGQNSLF